MKFTTDLELEIEKNPDEYLNYDLKYGLSEKPSPQRRQKGDRIEEEY